MNSQGFTPPRYFDRLCPTNSLELLNYSPPFNGLTIRNTCTAQVTYVFCVSAGSGSPGSLEGVRECAPQPLQTLPTSLSTVTLPGNGGVTYINATRSLSVTFFWCSDEAAVAPAGTRGAGVEMACVG